MLAIDDDAFVVKFSDLLVAAHHDGGDVVAHGEIPFFVEPVHSTLDVLVKVSTVEYQAQSNTALGGVFQCFKNRIFSPSPRPVHVKVLEREENFFFSSIEHVHQFVDAIIRANE